MPLRIDCGDVELSLNLAFGIHYKSDAKTDDERAARLGLINKAMEIKPNLEKTVLEQIADHLGYDQEIIAARVKERDDRNTAARNAEEKGRAEKAERRAGR